MDCLSLEMEVFLASVGACACALLQEMANFMPYRQVKAKVCAKLIARLVATSGDHRNRRAGYFVSRLANAAKERCLAMRREYCIARKLSGVLLIDYCL
jgi:hypothetical protein